MSINRGTDKEDVVHKYNGILFSHRKGQNSAICAKWMDLEIVILSEVSQKEKNKYYIIPLRCGFQKNGTEELIHKVEIETQM